MFDNIFWINETTFVKRISTQSEIEEWKEVVAESFRDLDPVITESLKGDLKEIEAGTLIPVGYYSIDGEGKNRLTRTQSLKVTCIQELSDRVVKKYVLRKSDFNCFDTFIQYLIVNKYRYIFEITRSAKKKSIKTEQSVRQNRYIVGLLRLIAMLICEKQKSICFSITSKNHAKSLSILFRNLRTMDSHSIDLLGKNNLELSILSYPQYMVADKYLDFFSQYNKGK